jgi:hypothetical protein
MSAATLQSGPGAEGVLPAATIRATIRDRRSAAISDRPAIKGPRSADLQFQSRVSLPKAQALHEDQVSRIPTKNVGRVFTLIGRLREALGIAVRDVDRTKSALLPYGSLREGDASTPIAKCRAGW